MESAATRSTENRGRGGKGLKRSKPASNLEGRTEGDLLKQAQADNVSCRKYKKRQRKDLTASDIEKILEATKQPFMMQKDVAQQFKISHRLVVDLVREAMKQPDKLLKLKLAEQETA